jgi:hypothetical protein
VAKYDESGNLLWVKQAGGSESEVIGSSIAVDSSGNSLVTGRFGGTATFCEITLTCAGYTDIIVAKIGETITGIQQTPNTPAITLLHQNYPNPFNPAATIRYDLSRASQVILKVYNMRGQTVRILINEKQAAGQHSVVWDGWDRYNKQVSSGIYIYQIQVDEYVQSRKMLLIR